MKIWQWIAANAVKLLVGVAVVAFVGSLIFALVKNDQAETLTQCLDRQRQKAEAQNTMPDLKPCEHLAP
jgi:hypothetical protein